MIPLEILKTYFLFKFIRNRQYVDMLLYKVSFNSFSCEINRTGDRYV